MLAPSPVQSPPYLYHRHEWTVIISSAVSKEWPHDNEDTVLAICSCGAQMTCEQIEGILNQ